MGKFDKVGDVTIVLLRVVVTEACSDKRKYIFVSQMGKLGYFTS